jgi:hypothetical protein
MVRLIGGSGTIYVGHQAAYRLGAWSVDFNEAAALSTRHGKGVAKLQSTDEYWGLLPPTRIVLRLGPTSWTWNNVSFQVHDAVIDFIVHGDPDIRRTEEQNGS